MGKRGREVERGREREREVEREVERERERGREGERGRERVKRLYLCVYVCGCIRDGEGGGFCPFVDPHTHTHTHTGVLCTTTQGRLWYDALRENGVETKLFTYPDDSHPLASIACGSDVFVNVALFFSRFL